MRRIGRILRHPATATACLLLSGAAWVAQFARTRNVYWISPGCSIEVGYGGGGLWVWAAERGTFELLGSGFHAVSGSPRRYVPEFRIDRGLEITTDYGSPSSIVNGVYAHMPAWIAATALLVPPGHRSRAVAPAQGGALRVRVQPRGAHGRHLPGVRAHARHVRRAC